MITYSLFGIQGRIEQAICLDCGKECPVFPSMLCECGGLSIIVTCQGRPDLEERLDWFRIIGAEINRLKESSEARNELKNGRFKDALFARKDFLERQAKGLPPLKTNPFPEYEKGV